MRRPDAADASPTRRRFTGRLAEQAELDELLDADRGAVVIAAVHGMAGVGKTALAVHWAHRVASDFPDGQLYVNLRGYDPGEPLAARDALGALLWGLGQESAAVPPDLAGRVAQYHRLLAGRRMLVLQNNAGGAAQVRPLLPPPPSVAVVTCRDDLSELVTVDGARRVTLGVLAESEAVALVRPLIGERADSEPEAVRTLARRCGNLPLALRVAAEHVASRPAVPLAYLVVELNDTLNHLDAFGTAGDERADLRSVFSWSVRRLPAQAARAFHLLGIVPGSDADVYGIAALAGVDLPEAGRLAQVMTQAHLIQPDGHGRFGLHDLLRAYAREGAARTVGPDECRAAATRLLDHYITSATVAVDLQFPDMVPDRRRNRPGPVLPTPALAFECVRAAAHWLAAQRDSVVRACMHAARHGWPGHAVALAQVVRPLLDNGHDRDGLTVLSEALDAAVGRPECDPLDVAFLHVWLALTNWRLGRIDAAAAHGEQALRETTRLACAEGITHSLVILGAVRYSQGRSPTRSTASSEGWRRHSTRATRMQEAGQLNNLTGGRP